MGARGPGPRCGLTWGVSGASWRPAGETLCMGGGAFRAVSGAVRLPARGADSRGMEKSCQPVGTIWDPCQPPCTHCDNFPTCDRKRPAT